MSDYLRPDHPRLAELKARYKRHPAALHSLWTETFAETEISLERFREDNAFIYQVRSISGDVAAEYASEAAHTRRYDALGLWGRCHEDGLFGAMTSRVGLGSLVSRDLLDSIWEMNLLERALHITRNPSLKVLDIGAGYGRLAHRFAEAFPEMSVHATDAVALSTFVCEFYLRFRGVDDRARTIPLDMVERAVLEERFHLATNIHSFQECRIASIAWWLDLLIRGGVAYLLIVAGQRELRSIEPNRARLPFQPMVESKGFELMLVESRYPVESTPPLERHPIAEQLYFLFRNKGVSADW
jgi:SAM-dependent methyltransferase